MNLQKSEDHKNEDVVKKMDGQIGRLTQLINELLDVTKIQKGQIQLNESYFDFDRLVNEVVEEQQMTSRHKMIVSRSRIGDVFADRHRISQVMANLISNAIKYSPDVDEVHISAVSEEDKARFSVRDFGIGIPADQQSKVFDQYYRISESITHTFPGLGLGLYISSEIIKRAGGEISVSSVEGEGSDFCFRIPKNKN
ncbi:sensor histidine kinase [Chryseobacterium gregarium]|uniref:sensor histidine kinase n=1 Tax=Chryseobacterium gregarium TaxID=456299 RepID=UPI000421C317|nr:HAMP domain-containing sensor histidine kinase [Chryseobacterium gregarium]